MKRILVPTDFSACAGNAVDFAIQSAKILPVEVVLLHSYELSGNLYTDYMGVNKEFNQSLIFEANDQLIQTQKDILEKSGIDVKAVFFRGTLQDGIAQTIDAEKIDLIIMGTTGASGMEERIWGSTTAAVIGHTHLPVLAIPKDYTWKKPERILVSTNHFEKEPAILNFIFEMAGLYMADVHVAVFTDEDDDLAETMIEYGRQIRAYSDFLKKEYRESSVITKNIFGEEFEKTICDYLEEQQIDLLVMITYQRSFWDRIFHPSITKRMSYHTHVPLLAIPAEKKEG